MKFFSASRQQTIPAYLSFDVEPDGFQLSRAEPPPLTGYEMTYDFAERLRTSLTARTGVGPRFGWYFRTDPQIAEVYGRPDYILATFPERMAHLESHGDYFGVHSHPVRWCSQRGTWLHDFGDAAWLAYCTQCSLDGFAQWRGARPEYYRAGAGFLSNTIIEVLEANGVKIDLSLEPVKGWGVTATSVGTAIDASPFIGLYTNCDGAPRLPFRPSRQDFRVPAGRNNGHALIMVPLTTYTLAARKPRWQSVAQLVGRGPKLQVEMLYPSGHWPDSMAFWDLAQRELDLMRRPYLSLAVRTDAGESELMASERRILETLTRHPLGERLRFVDPLEHVAQLLPVEFIPIKSSVARV
jgi:hypothetical protein